MTSFKTAALAVALAAMTSNAFAADAVTPANGPLAPGKPAGVKQAQDESGHTILWIVGAALVIGGIALVASGSGNGNTGNTSTGGT